MNRIPSLFKISWPELFLSSKCLPGFSQSVSPGAQQIAGPQSAPICCMEVPTCALRGGKGAATGALPLLGREVHGRLAKGTGPLSAPGLRLVIEWSGLPLIHGREMGVWE